MAKVFETTIDRFDGGIVNDPRDKREATARMITNFDNLTSPYRLVPYREAESGDSTASTSVKRNFAVARRTGTTYSLYALGVQSGANDAEVLYKDLSTGGANDLDDAGWSTPSNNQQTTGTTTRFEVFTYYQNQDEIYSIRDNQYIQAFSPTGSAWIDSEADLGAGINNAAEGLVHSKDDICYIPYDNKIASKNGAAAFNTTALTLPANMYITSIAEYGNYIAIAAAPLSGQDQSKVYLWNRDDSLTTLSESINWGEGKLLAIETISGQLVGVSLTGDQSDRVKPKIYFRRYVPGNPDAVIVETLVADNATSIQMPNVKQKVDDRMYFMMGLQINGETRNGVWSFGLSKTVGGFTINHERTLNNDDDGSSFTMRNFILIGEYLFQAFVDDGTHNVTKTTDTQTAFSAMSIYETKIFNTDSSAHRKNLLGVSVTMEPQSAAGQVVLEYAVDENIGQDSWTNIFTETTDNAISRSETAGLPKDYKELQFRIESTGGTAITSLSFKEEVTERKPY